MGGSFHALTTEYSVSFVHFFDFTSSSAGGVIFAQGLSSFALLASSFDSCSSTGFATVSSLDFSSGCFHITFETASIRTLCAVQSKGIRYAATFFVSLNGQSKNLEVRESMVSKSQGGIGQGCWIFNGKCYFEGSNISFASHPGQRQAAGAFGYRSSTECVCKFAEFFNNTGRTVFGQYVIPGNLQICSSMIFVDNSVSDSVMRFHQQSEFRDCFFVRNTAKDVGREYPDYSIQGYSSYSDHEPGEYTRHSTLKRTDAMIPFHLVCLGSFAQTRITQIPLLRPSFLLIFFILK
jgi:hypothetical protein